MRILCTADPASASQGLIFSNRWPGGFPFSAFGILLNILLSYMSYPLPFKDSTATLSSKFGKGPLKASI